MIYLDNAATSFPKPASIYGALNKCLNECQGNPGRGGHLPSRMASKALYEARLSLSELFHSSTPENVVFTHNATEALNTAIKGLAKKNSHILISDIEHNSVRRAVIKLQEEKIEYSIYKTGENASKTLDSVRQNIRPNTCMLVACHKSNICSRELPIAALGRLCKKYGIYFVVDASQSAGSCDIDINKIYADALCAPGHKGLYGIMGGGFILFNNVEAEKISTVFEGGSGVNSKDDEMPNVLPERLEAGTLPLPAICTMRAGADFVKKVGADRIGEKERALMMRAKDMLLHTKGIEVYCPDENDGCILLFNFKNIDCEDGAALLDKSGICVRAGLHCSPLAHNSIQTPMGGAVRASFGYFNSPREVELFYKEVKRIACGVY